MIEKSVSSISASDILELVQNEVAESRTLEFKSSIYGTSAEARKELLKDVSGLANTSGGDLILGIAEEGGVAKQVVGLESFDADRDIARLESTLRSGLDPIVPGILMKAVPVPDAGIVLLVRVPRSWSAPHMIRDTGRFYARRTNETSPMDRAEIRDTFESHISLPERIERWRDERVLRLRTGEGPTAMHEGAVVAVHIVPFSSFSAPYRIPSVALDRKYSEFAPPESSILEWRFNLDGYLVWGPQFQNGSPTGKAAAYCQVFRSGRVEFVFRASVNGTSGESPLNLYKIEKLVMENAWRYISALGKLGVDFPMAVLLSLLDVKGRSAWIHSAGNDNVDPHPCDREHLLLPAVLFEQVPDDLPLAMRPVFDSLWSAFGVPLSLCYSNAGRWIIDSLKGVPQPPVR